MADLRPTAVIAGASGVIGAAAVERFALAGWQVIAVSRRRPILSPDLPFTHVPVDLTDRDACLRTLAALPPARALVYAAVAEAPGLLAGWRDEELMALNGRMFANLLGPIASGGALRHVSIMQGAKAYGAHLHPVAVPLREDAPRDPHRNFYWLHEDLLRSSAGSGGFDYTIWRPQVLIGFAPGAAMNPAAPIGAYAAICRERGLAFSLPGDSEALLELVDADLLADALVWAAGAPGAANQTFNITNGDPFVLRHAWPRLAEAFGLTAGGEAPESFAAFFRSDESQQAWRQLTERHHLGASSLDAFLGQSHHYLDLLNGPRVAAKAHPALLSTIKLRQAGFALCRDSLEALVGQLRRMVELSLLPPLAPQA